MPDLLADPNNPELQAKWAEWIFDRPRDEANQHFLDFMKQSPTAEKEALMATDPIIKQYTQKWRNKPIDLAETEGSKYNTANMALALMRCFTNNKDSALINYFRDKYYNDSILWWKGLQKYLLTTAYAHGGCLNPQDVKVHLNDAVVLRRGLAPDEETAQQSVDIRLDDLERAVILNEVKVQVNEDEYGEHGFVVDQEGRVQRIRGKLQGDGWKFVGW